MSEYLKKRMEHILAGRPLKQPKKYTIPQMSEKRKEKLKEQKQPSDIMAEFFEAMRKKMVGVCQCGCGGKSQKHDDAFYRHCICHIFPKRLFPSIAIHPLNWVERSFWGGCHGNMDDRSMELWPAMADWDDIKEKFHVLAPLLTDDERGRKFYTTLEALIYKN